MHNGTEHSIIFAAETTGLCQRSLVRQLALILGIGIELFVTETSI